MQPLTLANIGFGQGLFVTPIQMVRAYAALLNGGWLVQPSLIKESLEHAQKEPPRRIFSQKVTEDVIEALLSVTEDKGTGVKARLDGFKVAGKTGTAQVVDPQTKKYSKSRYISSFIGFAVGVEPKLVILTALDSPRGVYYAAETAAPLFKQVLEVAANRFSIPAQPVAVTAMARPAVKEILHQTRAAPLKTKAIRCHF
jgi:cell division protein FtsI/penicillin-binding protein 2